MREILDRYQLDIEIGGQVSFARQITNSLHRHGFYEFCYCLEGHGEYVHEPNRWPVGPGDIFVSEPNVRHEISSYGHQNLEIYFLRIVIGDLKIEGTASENNSLSRFLKSHAMKGHERLSLRPYVTLLQSGTAQSDRLISALAFEMMDALATEDGEASQSKTTSEFDKLLQFIDANIDRRIAEKELADLMGTSERTLRRRFKATTGSTLQAEINHRRMRVAAHRLLSGFSVQEVGAELGIVDASQFHRSFVRAFGVSPKQFQLSYLPGRTLAGTRP